MCKNAGVAHAAFAQAQCEFRNCPRKVRYKTTPKSSSWDSRFPASNANRHPTLTTWNHIKPRTPATTMIHEFNIAAYQIVRAMLSAPSCWHGDLEHEERKRLAETNEAAICYPLTTILSRALNVWHTRAVLDLSPKQVQCGPSPYQQKGHANAARTGGTSALLRCPENTLNTKHSAADFL